MHLAFHYVSFFPSLFFFSYTLGNASLTYVMFIANGFLYSSGDLSVCLLSYVIRKKNIDGSVGNIIIDYMDTLY